MIIILCEPDDTSALWLASELELRERDCRILLPEELIVDSRLSLRLGSKGTSACVQLADGMLLDHNSTTAIVNRMQRFPVPVMDNASEHDIVYASEEARAAIVAWCSSLTCPILSPPTPYGPAGNSASDLVWRFRAASLGISTEDLTIGSCSIGQAEHQYEHYVLKIGNRMLIPVGSKQSSTAASAAQCLADYYSEALFTARFRLLPHDEALFLGIETLPNLRAFGTPVVDALLDWVDEQ